MKQKDGCFIFNHNKMKELTHLKGRLDTINRAFRGNKNNKSRSWINEVGRECYLLDSDGSRNGSSVPISLSGVRTVDILEQTDCPYKFNVYTLQMDYSYAVLDGEDKRRWIAEELRAHPDCTEEDVRYIEVYQSVLESCAIYNGKVKSLEYHYAGRDKESSVLRRSLSAAGILYIELSREPHFQQFKDIFYNQVLTKEDKRLLECLYSAGNDKSERPKPIAREKVGR